MADEAQNTSLKNDMTRTTAAEDAETRAARRELKQSSISDPVPDGGDDKDRPATPADDVSDDRNNELKDQLASPKKKRGHDQLDAAKDEVPKDDASVTSADSSKDRASRSEPEKKRHRDQDGAAEGDDEVRFSKKRRTSSPTDQPAQKKDQEDGKTADITTQAKDGNKPESTEKDPKDGKDAPQTSASAFAASGFGKLSAGTSPFAGLGGTTGSGFGSPGKAPLSSFASSPKKTEADAQPAASAPKLSFGGAAAASPFAAGTNGFGSGLGGGSVFGSAKPLSAFGSGASKPFQTQKGAKPFGAPDSDVEEEEEEETGEEGEGADKDKDRGGSPEKESDDKAKVKLHKGTYFQLAYFHRLTVLTVFQSTLTTARPVTPPYCQSEPRCLSTRTRLGKSEVLAC